MIRVAGVVLILGACGGVSSPEGQPKEPITVTIPEMQRIFAATPSPEHACMDLFAAGRRSCFSGAPLIPKDLREYARGGLFAEGYQVEGGDLLIHLVDQCFHYLCRVNQECARKAESILFFHLCVEYTNCCVAGLEQ